MCGICGIINLDGEPVAEQAVRKMMTLQKHRGPDDEGVFVEGNAGLGFVRLSIIDLTPGGHQPMVSDDGRYFIVFNGEIFNYIELRDELKSLGHRFKTNSDTEVLLSAWQQWGRECLHRFNGMWAFAIYDRSLRRLVAARDRYGIKPFYFYHDDRRLIFASEIPPLLAALDRSTVPDDRTIYDYLLFNRTDQTGNTFFRDIRKLPHGHILEAACPPGSGTASFATEKWYDLRREAGRAKPISGPDEFMDLLSASVSLRLRSDVPVGVCLSGGIDSSSIVSLLLKSREISDLNTFSAVYSRGQHGDESEFIREYAPLVRKMHMTTPDAESFSSEIYDFVRMHAEPVPETGVYAQYKVMQLAKGKVVVTLDGQGADELLAGYHYFFGFYYKDLLMSMKMRRLAGEWYHYVRNHRSLYGIRSMIYLLLPESLRVRAMTGTKGYISDSFLRGQGFRKSDADELYRSANITEALFNHFEYKLEHLLKWEDRNSMFFSLEARVPFLDHNLAERTLASEGMERISKGMTKVILREGTKGLVPEKIRMRMDKVGFGTPQDEWFRTPFFTSLISEVLGSKSIIAGKYVDRNKAVRMAEDHISGRANNAKEIWKMINLELWLREFFN